MRPVSIAARPLCERRAIHITKPNRLSGAAFAPLANGAMVNGQRPVVSAR